MGLIQGTVLSETWRHVLDLAEREGILAGAMLDKIVDEYYTAHANDVPDAVQPIKPVRRRRRAPSKFTRGN